MIPYWTLFGVVALFAYIYEERQRALFLFFLRIVALGIALFIGLRFVVGEDWFAYDRLLSLIRTLSFSQMLWLDASDPAYRLVNWITASFDAELWLTNLICSSIFAYGLYRLCRIQPEPWLAMLVAVPYLVIVVGMGYTRQAVALGFLMAGIATFIERESLSRFAVSVVLAASFHLSSVVTFSLVALSKRQSALVNLAIAVSVTLVLYTFFVGDEMDRLVAVYIDAQYQSEGALIRILMSATAAALFLVYQQRLAPNDIERRLWRNFSYASLGALVLLFILPSSTAVDRIALYLLPLQLVVLARIPGTILDVNTGRLAVIAYAVAVQFTWLNYASNAQSWVPYRSVLFPEG